MEQTIIKILKANQADTSVFHTHVSMKKPKGKYQFNRQTLEDFWQVYCDYMESTTEPDFGIAEKSQPYMPVLVDIDLKIRDIDQPEIKDSLYTEEQLKSVVSVYQSVLKHIVENCKEEDLICVVLEKEMYQQTKGDTTYFKNGFHLHFPIFLDKASQEAQLIPRVQDEIRELKLFKDLGIEDSSTVVDKGYMKAPWLLYGSSKEDGKPYKITKIYDSNLNKIAFEKAFKNHQIFNNKDEPIDIKGKVKYYLPRILSILPWNRPIKNIKKGIICPLKEKMKKERKVSSCASFKKKNLDTALDIAKKLLPMIADFRTEDRNDWMAVGWNLHNMTEGSPEGLELWCEFSSRCEEKYDENVCTYQWEHMVPQEYNESTLRHFARIDSPEEYRKFKNEQSETHILNSVDGSHNDVAKALYEEYGDEFVCASVANKIWYQFINHTWKQIEDGTTLREKISGPISQKYTDANKKMMDELGKTQDQSKTALLNLRIKSLTKVITNMKSSPYKNNVMRECMEVFYNPIFKDKLDLNPYLIAFENGVYDLKLNVFRAGRPDDYLSKNMPIKYVNFTDDDERVQEVHTALEQFFPDSSVRKYFLDVHSEVFVGGNHEKHAYFWLGEGNNGKTILQIIFEKMFGKFAIKMDTGNLTGKKPNPGAAYADLARAGGGVRWLVMEEPNSDEAINAGTMKKWSGNDSFYARDLFERGKDGREVTPLFKILFICVAESAEISLPSGNSVSIKYLKNNKNVLAWDEDKKGLVLTEQKAFLPKGKQKTLKLKLLDGRTIECTPEHKYLTSEEEWVEAKNLVPDETKLVLGTRGINSNDMFGDFSDMSLDEKIKCMTVLRIVGLQKVVYDGDKIDCETVAQDIFTLFGNKPDIHPININKYTVNIPSSSECFSEYDLYEYLDSDEVPLFLARELLASFLGKNIEIKDETCITIKVRKYRGEKMRRILQRFDIKSEENDQNVLIQPESEVLKFCEKVGVRYQYRKSVQLDRIRSYLNYKNEKSQCISFEAYQKENLFSENHYTLPVISIEESSEQEVYDLNIQEPFSSFVAEGIITHNCNKLPRIKYADKAVWNRVRVIPFESTFCGSSEPAPDSYEEQLRQKRFPQDKQFVNRIPSLLEPFAWVLLEHRKKNLGKPKIEPEKVMEATLAYQKQNDVYRQFVGEKIIEDENKTIDMTIIYETFKEWFKTGFPNQTLPIKNEMEEYFQKLWGNPSPGKKWKGYRLRSHNDDIESGDAMIVPEDALVKYEDDKKEEEEENIVVEDEEDYFVKPLLRKKSKSVTPKTKKANPLLD